MIEALLKLAIQDLNAYLAKPNTLFSDPNVRNKKNISVGNAITAFEEHLAQHQRLNNNPNYNDEKKIKAQDKKRAEEKQSATQEPEFSAARMLDKIKNTLDTLDEKNKLNYDKAKSYNLFNKYGRLGRSIESITKEFKIVKDMQSKEQPKPGAEVNRPLTPPPPPSEALSPQTTPRKKELKLH